MANISNLRRARIALSAAAGLGLALAAPVTPAFAQPTVAPSEEVTLSVGTGRLVQLNGTMQDLFVANEGIADVQVRSNTSVYIFGKAAGQTTVYATDRNGRVIYSASIRVGQNLASVDQMLELAMPEANITATPMNGLVLLTGTVAAPSDVEDPGICRRRHAGHQPPSHRHPAAGHAEGDDRGGEPLADPQCGSQPPGKQWRSQLPLRPRPRFHQ
jgi:pilus assembly protein CpaC